MVFVLRMIPDPGIGVYMDLLPMRLTEFSPILDLLDSRS